MLLEFDSTCWQTQVMPVLIHCWLLATGKKFGFLLFPIVCWESHNDLVTSHPFSQESKTMTLHPNIKYFLCKVEVIWLMYQRKNTFFFGKARHSHFGKKYHFQNSSSCAIYGLYSPNHALILPLHLKILCFSLLLTGKIFW